MKSIPTRFWFLAITLVALNVAGLLWIRHEMLAGPMPRLRVLSVSPTRDVDEADRFELVFDDAITLPETVGQKLDRTPFTISPELEGHWRWTNRTKLTFLLDKQLPPGREFVIRPAIDLESQTGRRIVGETEFRFQTRALDVESCEVQASDRTHVTIGLRFNQAVAPEDVERHTTVRAGTASNATRLDVELLSRKPGREMTLRAKRPDSRKLAVNIDKKLKGRGAHIGLAKSVRRVVSVNQLFSMRSTYVPTPDIDERPEVNLRFTSKLDTNQRLPKVSVSPTVKNLRVRRSYSTLELTGDFECGVQYRATVPGTLLSADGQSLGKDQSITFKVPDYTPDVSFPMSHGILMPGGNLTVDMESVNADALEITARRVHVNNIIAHLRGTSDDATSRVLVEKQIRLNGKHNKPAKQALDLDELLSHPTPGVYQIRARATNRYWARDKAVVAITNMGITVKQERDGCFVWVTALDSAKPLPGVRVSGLTYNNQVLAIATTNDDGVALLGNTNDHPDGPLWLITAELDDDISFIRPDRRPWVIDDVSQSGRAWPKTYDVMLYTERGVYRPGDTIRVTGIVREPDGTIPPAMPLSVTVTRPDGRQIADLYARTGTNGQGMFHVSLPTQSDGQTGRYKLTAGLPGSKKTLGETSALVEAFVPIRIELKSKPSQDRFIGKAARPQVEVSARYLFGQPAANLATTLNGTYEWVPFDSKQFSDFTFGDARYHKRMKLDEIKGRLDADGVATLKVKNPDGLRPGLWRARLTSTVTETGGRSVSNGFATFIDTASAHIGVKLPGGTMQSVGREFDVAWQRVTPTDQTADPAPVSFSLVRVEYDNVIEQINGRPVWRSRERLSVVKNKRVENDASGTVSLKCKESGQYRLTALDERSGSRTRIDFHAVSNASEAASVSMKQPERLELVLDKESYRHGENANVLLRAPFGGRVLLTVETNRVVHHQIVEIAENTATLTIPISDDLRGCAYISASVIRAIDPKRRTWLPHRAMGMARLMIDHRDQQPALVLIAPQKVLPGSTIDIEINTDSPSDLSRPGVVQLWAVDEGILLATSWRTPDPMNHFLSPRKSLVVTGDVYGDLLPDHLRPTGMARIGAGGDKDGGESMRRSSPVPSRTREPSVVWRESIKVGPDGRASVSMKMPQLNGRMRVMAVYVDHDRYAATEHDVILTSPLLVESSWPRFAAPGDDFDVPVKVFNNSGSEVSVSLSLDVDGPLDVALKHEGDLLVGPNESATVWAKATARSMGHVDVKVNAITRINGKSIHASAEAALPIRPVTAVNSESKLVRLPVGETFGYSPSPDFIPSTVKVRVNVSGKPDVQLMPAIEQLLDYPYGCVEQTTSRLHGILHAPDLIKQADASDVRADVARDMIDAGIARLWSMQTRSGGLSYWPGGRKPELWGTCYAAGFLIQAKRAGHRIDKQFTDELLAYLESEMDRRGDDRMDDNMRAVVCHVLSAFDKPRPGWMTRLTEQPDSLDIAGRAHLAAAWFATGRRDMAMKSLAKDTIGLTAKLSTSGRITSQLRQEAVLLNTLLDIDREHAWIPMLAMRLDKARSDGHWGTTLNTATALSALARYQAQNSAEQRFNGAIETADGRVVEFDYGKPLDVVLSPDNMPIKVRAEGEGACFVTVAAEGLMKAEAIKNRDSNLVVRRRWLDRKDKPVDPTKFKVGDLIQVEVEIHTPQKDSSVDNIAIVDALPAGLEVENPRLATSAGRERTALPDRVEFLDDRVVLFTSVSNKKRVFRYPLRVVTPGRFALPPIEASCMYDPSVASMHGMGTVVVEER